MLRRLIARLPRRFRELLFERHPLAGAALAPGEVAIDCGANVGSVTELMARRGAIVYAFEPNPYAFKLLKNKFENNQSVHCIEKGVWKCDGKMKLFLHERAIEDQLYWSTGSSLLANKTNVNEKKYVEVDVVDLAKFIEDLGRPVKLLKIDVEGAEFAILDRLIEMELIQNIDLILVETHEDRIPELRQQSAITRARIKDLGCFNVDLNWR
jgi:FkbM family methyltransferase